MVKEAKLTFSVQKKKKLHPVTKLSSHIKFARPILWIENIIRDLIIRGLFFSCAKFCPVNKIEYEAPAFFK